MAIPELVVPKSIPAIMVGFTSLSPAGMQTVKSIILRGVRQIVGDWRLEIGDWLTGDWGFCHELHEFYEFFGYKGIAILSDSQANNKSPISSLQSSTLSKKHQKLG